MTDAEIDAINMAGIEAALNSAGSWSYLDFARAVERQALERALASAKAVKTELRAQGLLPCSNGAGLAAYAIRALIEGTSKEST
ncbi:hypothetical protein IAG25_35415 [Caballeronia sp. EK]|uniref:hypothetical protein n=1 Tax=Caballeronia sp. EK TaxID=2767469 RepID=UPI001655B207|nr:hypothetical protein [Caballeronia sp. EK]MBC8642098.1 hypothetical protein [Caballeronia sp. EK]